MLFLNVYLLIYLLHTVHAIEVTPNSDCASFCITDTSQDPSDSISSSTQTGALVCNDWELNGPNSTKTGRTFHDCVQCQSNSTAVDKSSKENDLYWFLFNIKFTLDWCLFQYEDNNQTTQSRACSDTCAGPQSAMKLAMTDRVLQTNSTIQYQYCEDGSGAFTKNVDDCVTCLRDVTSSMALVNYLRSMKAGCEQQPKIGSGDLLELDFDLYDLASASASAASTSSAPTVTITSAPASTTSSSASKSSSSDSSSALKLGLGLGIGLFSLFLLAALLIFFLWRRAQSRKSTRLTQQPPAPHYIESEPKVYAQDQRTQVAEMQAPVSHPIPEADDGKPPVPEKDRWLTTPSSRSRQTSLRGGGAENELPAYEMGPEELDGGEITGAWGLRRGSQRSPV